MALCEIEQYQNLEPQLQFGGSAKPAAAALGE